MMGSSRRERVRRTGESLEESGAILVHFLVDRYPLHAPEGKHFDSYRHGEHIGQQAKPAPPIDEDEKEQKQRGKERRDKGLRGDKRAKPSGGGNENRYRKDGRQEHKSQLESLSRPLSTLAHEGNAKGREKGEREAELDDVLH